MKVRYIGNGFDGYLVSPFEQDKVYDVISIERGWYRIQCELEEDYLFPPSQFEMVNDTDRSAISDHKSIVDEEVFDLIKGEKLL